MGLKTLLDSIRQVPREDLWKVGINLVEKGVAYPPGWEDCKTEIYGATWRGPAEYNLQLSGSVKKPLGEVAPLLTALLNQARGLHFAPGAFYVNADVQWSVENFVQESGLADLMEVRLSSSFYACDPTKVRIGFVGKTHGLEVELKAKSLKVSAKGDYCTLIPRIIAEIKPQFATIRLSHADAQRLLGKLKGLRKWLMKRALQPEKRNYMALQMGGGISFNENEEIEVMVAASALPEYAEAIGKPLINQVTGEQTFVVNLTKEFLWKQRVLPTLHTLIRIIDHLEPSTLFGHPLLTVTDAKVLLEQEISTVTRYYENLSYTPKFCGSLVKTLAREHFGDDVLAPFDSLQVSEYLAFLQARGFMYEPRTEQDFHQPHLLKEKYLLCFFLQSYKNNPRDSVEQFRKWYVNSAPNLSITGETESDASRLAELSLPTQPLLTGFSVSERVMHGGDEVSIKHFSNKENRFLVCTPLESCQLLDLQDYACQIMGVDCN